MKEYYFRWPVSADLFDEDDITVQEWAKAQGYGRYLASSIKGEAAIDWSDKRARTALLAGIVADADRLLELSRQAQGELAEDSAQRQQIVETAELLGQLLLQDVERTEGGASLKDGVSRDHMIRCEPGPYDVGA